MIRDGLIGKVILQRSESLKIGKAELARRVGMPYTTLMDLLNGNSKKTKHEYLEGLARELNLSITSMVKGNLEPLPSPATVATPLSSREMDLIAAYRGASAAVKRAIEGAAGLELVAKKRRSARPLIKDSAAPADAKRKAS